MEKERTEVKSEDLPKQSKKQDGKKSQVPKEKREDNWYNDTLVPVLEWRNDNVTISVQKIKFYA